MNITTFRFQSIYPRRIIRFEAESQRGGHFHGLQTKASVPDMEYVVIYRTQSNHTYISQKGKVNDAVNERVLIKY